MAKLFLWEIKKNVKKKAVIAIGVVLAVMLVLIAVVFNFLSNIDIDEMVGSVGGQIADEDGLSEEDRNELTSVLDSISGLNGKITKEQLLALKVQTEEELKEVEAAYAEEKAYNYNARYERRSLLEVINYALDNGYYDKEVKILDFNYSLSGLSPSAENFAVTYAGIVMFVVLIYGIVMGAGLYANEYKSGTIKLVMTRPVAKNKLTLAKLFSLYASLTVMYCLPVLIGYIYGLIAFGSQSMAQVLYSFNSTSAGVTTCGALVFGNMVGHLVEILVLATVSFSLATVTRKSTLGLIVALVISFGISNLLSVLGITAFTLSHGFGFMNYFGLGRSVVYLGNFYLCIGVVVFWLAAAIAGMMVCVHKKDIN